MVIFIKATDLKENKGEDFSIKLGQAETEKIEQNTFIF
jgi:hypothetical protein